MLHSDSNSYAYVHSTEQEQLTLHAQVLALKEQFQPSIPLRKVKVNTIVIFHGVPEAGDTNPFYVANLLAIDQKKSTVTCLFLGQTFVQDGPFASTYKPLYLDSRQQYSTAPQPKSSWKRVESTVPWSNVLIYDVKLDNFKLPSKLQQELETCLNLAKTS